MRGTLGLGGATGDTRADMARLHTRRKRGNTLVMGWNTQLARGLRPLVDLVYPPRCPLCGEAVLVQGGLCGDCFTALDMPGEPTCTLCQRPLASPAAQLHETCFACSADPPRHAGIYAATLYNDASRRLILSFKHGGKIALAALMARLMATRLPEEPADESALLIPVPLHRWRIWQRGHGEHLHFRRVNQRFQLLNLRLEPVQLSK